MPAPQCPNAPHAQSSMLPATHGLLHHVQVPSSTTGSSTRAQQARPAKPEPQTSRCPRLSPDPGHRNPKGPKSPSDPKEPTNPALQGSSPHQQAAAAEQAKHSPGLHTGPAASRRSPGSQVQLLCSVCAVLLAACVLSCCAFCTFCCFCLDHEVSLCLSTSVQSSGICMHLVT